MTNVIEFPQIKNIYSAIVGAAKRVPVNANEMKKRRHEILKDAPHQIGETVRSTRGVQGVGVIEDARINYHRGVVEQYQISFNGARSWVPAQLLKRLEA